MRELAGRTALVTGASHGLGPYIARALAAKRKKLVLAARSAAELDALAAELRRRGLEALPVPADLAPAVGRYGMPVSASVMLLIQAAAFFGPPPPNDRAAAFTALASYALFAAGAGWLDRRRA